MVSPHTTNSLLASDLSAWSCLCPWPLPALSLFTSLRFFKELGSDSSSQLSLLRSLTPQPDRRCPSEPDRFAWSSTTAKKEVYFDCQGHWELGTMSNRLKCMMIYQMSLWCLSFPLKLFTKLQMCFVFVFMCLMKHIRRIGYGKIILHFCLVNSLTLSVDIILNGSQITFCALFPKVSVNVAFTNDSKSNCKILDVLYFALPIWILSQQCLPCYLKYSRYHLHTYYIFSCFQPRICVTSHMY